MSAGLQAMPAQWIAIVVNTPILVPIKVDGGSTFSEGEVFTRQQLAVALGVSITNLTLHQINPACGPNCQPSWAIGTTPCQLVYLCAQPIELEPLLKRLSKLEEKVEKLLLGQLAYALMEVVRNHV